MKFVTSRIFGAAVLSLASICVAAPSVAQEMPGAGQASDFPFNPPSEEALAFSQERGVQLFLYDQAAWHSTDVFLAEFDAETLGQYMRGYVVVPSDTEGSLDAIYFGDFGAGFVEVARYTVQGDTVLSGGFHPADARPALSDMAIRLAGARQAVVSSLGQVEIAICANAQANTVAIPNGDGADVYILTPIVDMDSFPLGGHYRFSVDAEGTVTILHRLEEGCPIALMPQIDPDTEAVVLTPVEFVRAPEPSEIHVFASMMRPVPLFVETPRSRTVWVVDQGTIREVTEDDFRDAPPDDVPAETVAE